MSKYNKIYNENTDKLLTDIYEYLINTENQQSLIDTLDLCHIFGKLDVLQQRIEKAVEYIKEHSSNGEHFMEWFECSDLLNILRGEDNE